MCSTASLVLFRHDMGIHSVFLVGKSSKNLIYSRYFDTEELLSCVDKQDFEYLLLQTNRYWSELQGEKDRFCVYLDGTVVALVRRLETFSFMLMAQRRWMKQLFQNQLRLCVT